jgi:hypothetical protein
LIVNNIGNMMMMAKQVYKVVVMLMPPMLVIILLAKQVAAVMEVVVVAVLGRWRPCGFAPKHVRRQCDDPNFAQPAHRDEDGLGKPKFTMPKFMGSTDVEEYWRCFDARG